MPTNQRVHAGTTHEPVAGRPRIRLSILGIAAVGLVLSGGLHHQSAGLTGAEVLIGGGIATLTLWGVLSLLVAGSRLSAPVRWAFRYALWCVANVAIAMAVGTPVALWMRFVFPAIVFPGFLILGWGCFRSLDLRIGVLVGLAGAAAVVVLLSLSAARSVALGTVQNLQALRVLGGNYFSAFAVTLALPLLLTAAGRRILPWAVSAVILAIGMVGLAISFTRTYWLATAASTATLIVLLAWERRGEFRRLLAAAPLVLVAAAAVLVAAPGKLLHFGAQRLSSLEHIGGVGSLQERLRESATVLAGMLQDPLGSLVGKGFAARFDYEWVNPVTGVVQGGLHLQYMHDYYVYLLFSTGVVGLVLFLSVWYSAFRALARRIGRDDPARAVVRLAALTAGVNLLITSVAAPPLMEYEWTAAFGLLLGVALR